MMGIDEAMRLVGHQPTYALRNMVKALNSLGKFFNSEDDNKRLEASIIVLKSRKD